MQPRPAAGDDVPARMFGASGSEVGSVQAAMPPAKSPPKLAGKKAVSGTPEFVKSPMPL